MPVNIFDLVEDRKEASLEIGVNVLNVRYRPNQLTPAREMAMLRQAASDNAAEDDASDDEVAIATAQRNIDRQIGTFAELVEWWDFEGPLARGADGERLHIPRDMTGPLESQAFVEQHPGAELLVRSGDIVPATPEYLRLLPSHFLMLVVNLINEDMRPKQKRRRN